MSSQTNLTVAVVGSTGSQGSAVVNALSSSPAVASIRALSRNLSSPKSLALSSGKPTVTNVAFDARDIESVKAAFQDVDVVFAITIPDDATFSEFEQGKRFADVAKEQGVKLFIWSSLPSAAKISGGKYTGVTEFEEKVMVDEYIKRIGLPAVFLYLGWFCENWTNLGLCSYSNKSNLFQLTLPAFSLEHKFGHTWVARDLGPAVLAVIGHQLTPSPSPDLNHSYLSVLSFMASPQDILAQVEAATGSRTKYFSQPASEAGSAAVKELYKFLAEFKVPDDRGQSVKQLHALGFKPTPLSICVREVLVPLVSA